MRASTPYALASIAVESVPDVQMVILVCMSTAIRHVAAVFAVMALITAGCGGNGNADKAEPGAGLDDQRATVVSEFERAVQEARYLREDIAAVRADMKAVREAANHEAERASKEAAGLRDEITAIRLEMKELGKAAASEVERTAEEAKSLREEVAAIRAGMSAVRQAVQEAESLSSDEIAGNLTKVDEYPGAVVIDDNVTYLPYSSRRRAQERVRVIYAPQIAERRFTAQRRNFRRDGHRQSRSGNGKRRASQSSNPKPAAPGSPNVSNPTPTAPSRPNVSDTRPQAPNARPVAPAVRPARPPATFEPKKVHIPTPRR